MCVLSFPGIDLSTLTRFLQPSGFGENGGILMAGAEQCLLNGTGDLGVAEWGKWSPRKIYHHLGLPSDTNNWPLFVTPTDATPDVPTLRWHQCGAQIFLTSCCFTTAPSLTRTGCILTDEVGLGKTSTGLAFIAYVCTLYGLLRESKIPPILGKHLENSD